MAIKLQDWEPLPPNQGPPLPRFLDAYLPWKGYWPWYKNLNPSPNPPVASFSATPTSGTAPLAVEFYDTSTNNPLAWYWDFGDGGVSSLQNPTHIYQAGGSYTARLVVTNSDGQGQATVLIAVATAILKGTVSGKVTDSKTGSPLSVVAVTLGTSQTQTDVNGLYSFTDVPAGDYNLGFYLDGYTAQGLTISVTSAQKVVNTAMVPITTPPPPPPPDDIVAQIIAAHGFKILKATYSNNICTIQYVTGITPTSNIKLLGRSAASARSPVPSWTDQWGNTHTNDDPSYWVTATSDFSISSTPGVYTISIAPNTDFLAQLIAERLIIAPIEYFQATIIVFATNARTGAVGSMLANDSIDITGL